MSWATDKKKIKSWSWSQKKSSLLSWINNSQRISKVITGRYLQKIWKGVQSPSGLKMAHVMLFSSVSFPGCDTPACLSWRLCSSLWQQIMKRICRRRHGRCDWRDLCHSPQIALQSVTFAKAGQGETLRRPFIRKWCASAWWAPSPHLFFIFGTRPVNAPHSASAVCAGGVWAHVKWPIKRRSEQVIFPCLVFFSLNVSLINPLHISSDLSYEHKCLS